MIIAPTAIDESGPGIDLTNQPEGVAIAMSDPVTDFEYARNAVTLTFDLSGAASAQLEFAAMEFGDEPHAPPSGPFGDGVNFDGVAISEDGVDWYEIQDLRSLRSDKFTSYDIDLNVAAAAVGLSFGPSFRIRFCQYDNNPAPKDGIFVRGIAVAADLRPAILHLMMDDNVTNPTVLDSSAGGNDQTFLDPGGNPNTDTHSVPGRVGAALQFDGLDDRIVLTSDSYRPFLEANQDFSIAFWWKTNSPTPGEVLHFVSNTGAESFIFWYTKNGNVVHRVTVVGTETRIVQHSFTDGADNQWHHYVLTRSGTLLSFYRDGALALSDDHPENTLSLAPIGQNMTIGSNETTSRPSPGFADDFRVYDRALLETEIAGLAG